MQGWKESLTVFLIRHSSLFDAEWYRRQAGIDASVDAARHYYEGGWRGQDPSPRFSQKQYLAANEDVRAAGVCPLGHYLLYGRRYGQKLYPGMPEGKYRAHRVRRAVRRRGNEILFRRLIQRNRQARILVIAHLYYEEALEEMLEYLKNLRPYRWDLAVTVPEERDTPRLRERVTAVCPEAKFVVTENRGYDIAPFLTALRGVNLSDYDVVIKAQTKQLFSREGQAAGNLFFRGRDWFLYLMESTLGAGRIHRNIDLLMRGGTDLIAARQLLVRDTEGRARLTALRLSQVGLRLPEGYTFAAGSGFCARAQALRFLQENAPGAERFAASRRGEFSLAHAMERYLTGALPQERKTGVPVCSLRWAASRRAYLRQQRRQERVLRRRLDAARKTDAAREREDGTDGGRREGVAVSPGIGGQKPLTFAFAVTETGEKAVAGDYFTALELAEALQRRGCRVRFLSRHDPERPWEYVGKDADVVISLLQSYPMDRLAETSDRLIRVGWARNWFDQWMELFPWKICDLMLASSPAACADMSRVMERPVSLFPIAVNPRRFDREALERELTGADRARFSCDYCFTGNRFGLAREIEEELDPESLPYSFKIFGAGWQGHERLSAYACGHVEYAEVPRIYPCVRVVLDDATPSTRETGAMNSRVFDALCAGCLVITNNEAGAAETFRGMLPTFHDKASLRVELRKYLEDEELRRKKTEELRAFVLANHTYDLRAGQLMEWIWEIRRENGSSRGESVPGRPQERKKDQ